MLIEQLKHVPIIKSLTMQHVSNLDYERRTILHENTSNLKHFVLDNVICTFVEIDTVVS
jgi:hypothetical protein